MLLYSLPKSVPLRLAVAGHVPSVLGAFFPSTENDEFEIFLVRAWLLTKILNLLHSFILGA